MLTVTERYWLPKFSDCLRILLMSDLHIGSAAMDEDLLRSDLEWAKEHKALVFIAGDVFDLILPKDHKRYTPEVLHPSLRESSNVLNATLKMGVRLLKPYANHIKLIGCGNHETSVQKWHATDIVALLCEQLSTDKHKIVHGGYMGGVSIPVINTTPTKTPRCVRRVNLFYHHGVGGSSPVTKGMIDFNRFSTWVDGAHVLWFGHKHNRFVDHAKRLVFPKQGFELQYMDQLRVMSGSYAKDGGESQFDSGGSYRTSWERERGFAPQGRGGIKLAISFSNYVTEAGWDDRRIKVEATV